SLPSYHCRSTGNGRSALGSILSSRRSNCCAPLEGGVDTRGTSGAAAGTLSAEGVTGSTARGGAGVSRLAAAAGVSGIISGISRAGDRPGASAGPRRDTVNEREVQRGRQCNCDHNTRAGHVAYCGLLHCVARLLALQLALPDNNFSIWLAEI